MVSEARPSTLCHVTVIERGSLGAIMHWTDFTRRAVVGLVVIAIPISQAHATSAAPKRVIAMERVVGIGGFFFRAKDPKALARWYKDNLGILLAPESYDTKPWRTDAGTTVFAPYPKNSPEFGDSTHDWIINFRVRDLDKMAAQLRANGIAVKIDPQVYPNGRFAKLHDPEGNPIQLWQPGGEDRG